MKPTHQFKFKSHDDAAAWRNISGAPVPSWVSLSLHSLGDGCFVGTTVDGQRVQLEEGAWVIADTNKKTVMVLTDSEFTANFTELPHE